MSDSQKPSHLGDHQTADVGLSLLTVRRAMKWLIFEHGMEEQEASEVIAGIATPNSRYGSLRQEAIDVAYFVEHLGYV